MTTATIIVPTRNRADRLTTLLRHLDRQRIAANESFDVIIAFDGDRAADTLYKPSNYAVSIIELPRVGISAAKNRAIAQARGDFIILVNDDIEPSPTFVHQHFAAQRSGHPIVLGDAPFCSIVSPTLFDQCIAQTGMIFGYPSMQAGRQYGFRTAWNLNLSIRADLIRDMPGPFAESLRPCMYEDLELARRIIGKERGIYFHPQARARHNHRYTFEGYLRREAMLGTTAPNLWNVNRDCFVAIFGQPLDALVETARRVVNIDNTDAHRLLRELSAFAVEPCDNDDSQLIAMFYRAHMPLKRRAFRCGMIAATQRSDIEWNALADVADQSLDDDDVFCSLASMGSFDDSDSAIAAAAC